MRAASSGVAGVAGIPSAVLVPRDPDPNPDCDADTGANVGMRADEDRKEGSEGSAQTDMVIVGRPRRSAATLRMLMSMWQPCSGVEGEGGVRAS